MINICWVTSNFIDLLEEVFSIQIEYAKHDINLNTYLNYEKKYSEMNLIELNSVKEQCKRVV